MRRDFGSAPKCVRTSREAPPCFRGIAPQGKALERVSAIEESGGSETGIGAGALEDLERSGKLAGGAVHSGSKKMGDGEIVEKLRRFRSPRKSGFEKLNQSIAASWRRIRDEYPQSSHSERRRFVAWRGSELLELSGENAETTYVCHTYFVGNAPRIECAWTGAGDKRIEGRFADCGAAEPRQRRREFIDGAEDLSLQHREVLLTASRAAGGNQCQAHGE